MVFNSYTFLFYFLPIVVLGFFLVGKLENKTACLAWLLAASIVFYICNSALDVLILAVSICFNFSVGRLLGKWSEPAVARRRTLLLTGALAANVALLGYYKHLALFGSVFNRFFGFSVHFPSYALPLGLSFFTFTQIMFLLDAQEGPVEFSFLEYALFVSFFPYVISGPIHNPHDVIPQFRNSLTGKITGTDGMVGLTLFLMGLFKKTILADGVGVYATPVFNAASHGTPLSFFEVWFGALAYVLQLYFDFSGYTDMAVGLARLFGIRLRINFNSPFKATSVVDFWSRWHMTLTHFLTNYLYNPMVLAITRRRVANGSNNNSAGADFLWKVAIPMMVTMSLAGLWHGGAWKFLVFGAMHGVYIVIGHGWHRVKRAMNWVNAGWRPLNFFAARAITFISVVISFLFFRADNCRVAVEMFYAMLGKNGMSLPKKLLPHFARWEVALAKYGITFHGMTVTALNETVAWVVVLLVVVFLLPNTNQMLVRFEPGLKVTEKSLKTQGPAWWMWRPSLTWGLVVGVAAAAGIIGLSQVSSFLYFQF